MYRNRVSPSKLASLTRPTNAESQEKLFDAFFEPLNQTRTRAENKFQYVFIFLCLIFEFFLLERTLKVFLSRTISHYIN